MTTRRYGATLLALAALTAASSCASATAPERNLDLDVRLSATTVLPGEAIVVDITARNAGASSIDIVLPNCPSSLFHVIDPRGRAVGPACGGDGSRLSATIAPGEQYALRTTIGEATQWGVLPPGAYVGVAAVFLRSGARREQRVSFTVTDAQGR
jgi:hypothetical protein